MNQNKLAEQIIGQRWFNEAELSLGLGTLVGMDERTLRIDFGSMGETRTYARGSALLARARFEAGDQLQDRDGNQITVIETRESRGLLTYIGDTGSGDQIEIPELSLSDYTQLSRANQRLFAGQIDKTSLFSLRQKARTLLDTQADLKTQGLLNGRTSLIPHQLYIGYEVAGRTHPRVVLADEVGLGKTIEAGLILSTKLIRGEISRVLIIVPEALQNQWLVEMLRRFNLRFSLYDRDRCESYQESTGSAFEFIDDDAEAEVAQGNIFEQEQLILVNQTLFSEHPQWLDQALAAEWDMLIVDEAHHLRWSPEEASPEYRAVERLAACIPSVLLLTATPEQLGVEGHFARLRLLDPDRFFDLEAYQNDEKRYAQVAKAVETLESDISLERESEIKAIPDLLGASDLSLKIDQLLSETDTEKRALLAEQLSADVLDRHGTGRLLFRNSRAAVGGFPKRLFYPYALQLPEDYKPQTGLQNWRSALTPECDEADGYIRNWTSLDPRVAWLQQKLKQLAPEKVLIIAARADTALDLADALRLRTGHTPPVFHEGLSIVERDRAAAYFADLEGGSQCLVCSEIGSEGRNFQFAHHLVLFDLPANPDLLEQRIGRLDRIGQTKDVHIHAPYLAATTQERLLRFYDEALGIFEQSSSAAQALMDTLSEDIDDAMQSDELDESFLVKARQARTHMEAELKAGRDCLIEKNSLKLDVANQLIEEGLHDPVLDSLKDFVKDYCDLSGIDFQEQSDQSVVIRPTESMTEAVAELPDEGMTCTFSRDQALSNEDMQFLTVYHPFVIQGIETLLKSERGNTSVVTMKVKGVKPGKLALETLFSLSAPIGDKLMVGRFLPSSRLRFVLDERGALLKNLTEAIIDQYKQPVKKAIAANIARSRRELLSGLIQQASNQASKESERFREKALANATHYYDGHIDRLQHLAKVNPSVKESEVQSLFDRKTLVVQSLNQIELSLDALRVIVFI